MVKNTALMGNMSDSSQAMSSLEIAELTGKEHKTVIRDVKNMLSDLYGIDGTDLYHQQIQGITVTKDSRNYISRIDLDYSHTITLVTGYDTKARKKVVDRWIALENELPKQRLSEHPPQHDHYIPVTYSDALLLAAKQASEIETQKKHIKVVQPKADAFDNVIGPSYISIVDFVRTLPGVNSNRVYMDLQAQGVLYRYCSSKKGPTKWKVKSNYRDTHFVETWDIYTKKKIIKALPEGKLLLSKLYRDRKLSIKVSGGWQKKLDCLAVV